MRSILREVPFPRGLLGAFTASTLSLGLGLFVSRAGGPGLVTVAAALIALAILRREATALTDCIVERLMLLADAAGLALLATTARRLHADEIDWLRSAPVALVLILVSLTLASIAASAVVDRLTQTAAWLRRGALASVIGLGGLLVLASSQPSIPVSYRLGALLGCVVGAVIVRRAARHHRLGRALALAVEGTLDDRGTITFADGSPPVHATRAQVARVAPGRVVVTVRAAPARAPGYRSADRREVETLRAGPLEDRRHAARLRGACDDALALGVAALAGSPLAVALMTMSRSSCG